MKADTAQSGLFAAVTQMLDEEHRSELIGGFSIAQVLDAVDLDVAFSPVIPIRGSTQPVEAIPTMGGESYILDYGDDFFGVRHAEAVHAESLKVMRARFLLQRDSYYQMLLRDLLPHSSKQRVVNCFFPNGAFIPKGDLRDGMLNKNWQPSEHEMANL